MGNDIALTHSQRTNIGTLRDIQALSDRTTERVTTGREVNNVVDDAVAYFTAKSLTNRGDDFGERKDEIDQGISSLEATLNATEAVEELLKQMKGIAEASRSQTSVERANATQQFNEIGGQISALVEDASYRGFNLLSETNNKLEVKFSDFSTSFLEVGGFDFNSTSAETVENLFYTRQLFTNVAFDSAKAFVGLSAVNDIVGTLPDGTTGTVNSFTTIGAENSGIALVNSVVTQLDDAIDRVRAATAELGSNISLLTTRLNFTTDYIDTLYAGSDKLTLADMNEEGANLVALQTRQQLGIQSLAVAGQQQQSILTLIQ